MTPVRARDELARLTATEHGAAVRAGRVTARAGVVAALERIAALDPRLRAVSAVRAEAALAEADALDAGGPGHDGALAGVPVVVKEALDVAGLVTTRGGLGNSTPVRADCEAVRRLRAAGAVVVAKTTMSEVGQFPFTESAARGVTHNPWDVTRSPGGSSGGSAVAVASRMVPLGVGTDGGGSVRIPASCCGLVGVKPARGRVSSAPHSDLWGALGVIGPLGRTALDAALLLDVLSGTTPVDRFRADPPPIPFSDRVVQPLETLRIAWTTTSVTPGITVDEQVAAATERVAEALAGRGHDVEHIEPLWPWPTGAFVPQFHAAVRAEARLVEHPQRLEWRTRSSAAMGAYATPRAVAAAERAGARMTRRLTERLARWDVILTPVMACLPPPVGQLDGAGSLHAMARALPMISFTTLANVTGLPAVCVPAGRSREGWPVGVQLASTRHEEGLLLAVAGVLEGAADAGADEVPGPAD